MKYTPVVAAGRSNRLVRFIAVSGSDKPAKTVRAPVSLNEYVMLASVPVMIRDALEKDGLKLANRVYLFRRGLVRSVLRFVLIVPGVIALVLLLCLFVTPFTNRKKLHATREHQRFNRYG